MDITHILQTTVWDTPGDTEYHLLGPLERLVAGLVKKCQNAQGNNPEV